ncbi:MAG: NUDIX domain-containing protein [Chloroflexota bacterium]|nr:NUDIX domain-containing protein [Chloroflexota bacterium]
MKQRLETSLHLLFPVVVALRGVYRRLVRPITVGVRALVVNADQVLLVRTHGSQEWVLPGGAAKRGESLRAAAEREAREETGCVVEAERLLGVYLSVHEGMTNHVAVFVCRALSPPSARLNLEIAEARYWSLAALPSRITPSLPIRLAEHAAGAQGLDGPW